MDNVKENVNVETERRCFPFFRILYANILYIACIIVLCGLIGTAYGYLTLKPVYTQKCNIMLRVYREYGTSNTTTNNSLARQYMPTITSTIKSPAVIELAKVIRGEENIDKGIKRSAVSIKTNTDSFIFSISYADSSPELAEKRLQDVLEATNKLLKENDLFAVRSVELIEMQNSFVLSVSNKLPAYVLIGFAGGIVLGIAFAVLKYILDNKLKSPLELEEIVGASLLSSIDK